MMFILLHPTVESKCPCSPVNQTKARDIVPTAVAVVSMHPHGVSVLEVEELVDL
jgi:hypothetical protein